MTMRWVEQRGVFPKIKVDFMCMWAYVFVKLCLKIFLLLPVECFSALWYVEQLRLAVWKLKECLGDKTQRKTDTSCRYPRLPVDWEIQKDGCNDSGITRQVYGHWEFLELDTWDSGHLPEAGQSPPAIRVAFGPNRCPSAAAPEDRAR